MNKLALAGCFSIVVACGSSKPEPAAVKSEAPPASDTPSSAASAPPASSSSTPAAPSSAAAVATASGPLGGAAPPPPPSGGATISETKDDCTPVGVDFEKRARPKLKECYQAGKKKEPNLEGTVKIKIVVDVKGKIKSTKVIEKTLPEPVANCMLGVIKQTPFPEVDKCWDATLTIPITFPTPK